MTSTSAPPSQRSRVKRSLQIAAGLLVSGFCLWFTFRGFDVAQILAQIATFSVGWLAPAVALFCLSFGLRGARWRWILSSVKPLPFWTVAPALIFGFFMNSVLPARGGEVARAFAISKKGDIPVSSALGSIVAERTMDLFGLAAMMLFASRLLPWDRLPIKTLSLSAGALLCGMVAATWVLSKLPAGRSPLAKKVISFIAQLGAGFAVVRRPSKVAGLIVLSVIIWTLDVVTMLMVGKSAGIALSLAQGAALNVGIAVGVMIPAAPGYVGTYELFGKEMLVMLGFAPAAALTFIVFLHFFQLAMIFALGIPSLFAVGARARKNEY